MSRSPATSRSTIFAGSSPASRRHPQKRSGGARTTAGDSVQGVISSCERPSGDRTPLKIGVETGRGPWVAALVASGYLVYVVNPLQSARARQGNAVSGAKSDTGDAHVLADRVRTHCPQLRTVAGDSAQAGHGATVRALAALITTSNQQIDALEGPMLAAGRASCTEPRRPADGQQL